MYLLCGIDFGYNTQYLSFGELWLQYKLFYHEVVDSHHLFKFPMETRHMFIKASVSYLAHLVHDDSPLVGELPAEEVLNIDIESRWELYFDGASWFLTVKKNSELT